MVNYDRYVWGTKTISNYYVTVTDLKNQSDGL